MTRQRPLHVHKARAVVVGVSEDALRTLLTIHTTDEADHSFELDHRQLAELANQIEELQGAPRRRH